MSEFKSYRNESTKDYGVCRSDGVTLEQLQAGCLLRIADATEKMAQRHTELIRARDYFEGAYHRESDFRRIAERSNAALRGQITKLRRQLVKEREISSWLAAELNATNGPTHLREPAPARTTGAAQ